MRKKLNQNYHCFKNQLTKNSSYLNKNRRQNKNHRKFLCFQNPLRINHLYFKNLLNQNKNQFRFNKLHKRKKRSKNLKNLQLICLVKSKTILLQILLETVWNLTIFFKNPITYSPHRLRTHCKSKQTYFLNPLNKHLPRYFQSQMWEN